MSQVKITKQYDETAGNVPQSYGYRIALQQTAARNLASEITGVDVDDNEQAKEILQRAFAEFPEYLAANFSEIF